MPAKLQHDADLILARILWANRGLGTDPAPWLTFTGAGGRDVGTRPTAQWPVFAGAEPGEPDNVITVRETTPEFNARIQVTGEVQQKLGFQVRVRGKNRATAKQKARDVAWDFERNFIDQQVTLTDPTQQYLIPSIAWVQVIDVGMMPVHPHLYIVTINVLANVLAYPITG